jgi:hypothetical protein
MTVGPACLLSANASALRHADLGVSIGEQPQVFEGFDPIPPGGYSGNHSAPRSRDITANR